HQAAEVEAGDGVFREGGQATRGGVEDLVTARDPDADVAVAGHREDSAADDAVDRLQELLTGVAAVAGSGQGGGFSFLRSRTRLNWSSLLRNVEACRPVGQD